MQIQLTIPTKVKEKELSKLLQKVKDDKNITIGDWDREKVSRFEIDGENFKENIQLSPNKANITFDSNPISVKIAIEVLRPFFKILEKENPDYNFLRYLKMTPEEFNTYENFKIKNPEDTLIDKINILNIPNKKFMKELLKTIIRSANVKMKDFKKLLENYNDPTIPKCYIESLKKLC
jgi:tRNA(Ile)-lysidine synthase TilS/MesJ